MTSQPTTIGPYEVLRELDWGGMGVVYLARDPQLEREVAIKVLPDLMARDKQRVLRFEREAKLLASLNHTNIAQIHGLEESDGKKFLIGAFTGNGVEADTVVAISLDDGSIETIIPKGSSPAVTADGHLGYLRGSSL